MKAITTLAAAAVLAFGVTAASAQSSQAPIGGGGGVKEGTASQEGGGQTNPSQGFRPELNAGPGANPSTGGTIVPPAERGATTGEAPRGTVVAPPPAPAR